MSDTSGTKLPVCPYCGHAHKDAWEWNFGNSECFEVDCESCGKPFLACRNISVDYSTCFSRPVDGPDRYDKNAPTERRA